jgi:hypothetical protein
VDATLVLSDRPSGQAGVAEASPGARLRYKLQELGQVRGTPSDTSFSEFEPFVMIPILRNVPLLRQVL